MSSSTLLMHKAVESREVFLNAGVIGLIQKIQGQLPSKRKSCIPFPNIPPGRTIRRVIIVRQRSNVSEHVWSPERSRFNSVHGVVRPVAMASREMKQFSVFQIVCRCIGQKIEGIHLE